MKKFFKTLWGVAWPLLLYYGMTFFISFVTVIIYAGNQIISGGGIDFVTLYDLLLNTSVIQTGILAAVTGIIMWLSIRHGRKSEVLDLEGNCAGYCYERFGTPAFGTYVICILGAAGAAIAANFIVGIVSVYYDDPTYDMVSETLANTSIIIEVIVAVILAPIGEELIFRGKMYDVVDKAYGPIVAVIVTSLIFGSFHANVTQFIYATLVGAMFGWMRYKTGSLTITIVMHIAANLTSVIAEALLPMIPFANIMYGELIVECLAAAVGFGLVAMSLVCVRANAEKPQETQ